MWAWGQERFEDHAAMQPQAKEGRQPIEAGRGTKQTYSWNLRGSRALDFYTEKLSSGFCSLEL
jgi:hypothetical protein